MNNKFGYAPLEHRSIEIEKFNPAILKYVIQHEPSMLVCLSCGGCTATCSAGNLTDFNVRRLQLMLRRGENESLQTEIDKCMLCGKCLLVCPRGVNLRNVVMLIKKALVLYKEK